MITKIKENYFALFGIIPDLAIVTFNSSGTVPFTGGRRLASRARL
jgi:hypothetical protein